ncbi:MAG: fluoride efflux transporter CrcB [Bacteroidota bacterium]|jgi:CrcB protein
MKWVAVFVGGGLGSLVRFALGSLMASFTSLFPWPTLVANTLAAVIIAFLFSAEVKEGNELMWQLAAIGFCGGLSTFSTFSMETVQLIKAGHTAIALSNMMLSILLSCLLFYFIVQWFQRT